MKHHERIAWVVLAAIMMLVAVVFVRRHPLPPALPEISRVGPFALTNQFGLRVSRDDIEGWVVIADVIFSRCPGQCHQLSQAMAKMQSMVPMGSRIRFLSLSADPTFDTPDILAKYGRRYGAEGERWHFLTGPKREVYTLATEGMKFSVVENESAKPGNLEEQFIHASSFAIMDRRGMLRAMVQLEDPRCVERVVELATRLSREDWK